jgi:hypothetical protein
MGRKIKKPVKSIFTWKKTLDKGLDITYTCFLKGKPVGSVWTFGESESGEPERPSPWYSGLEGSDERLPDYGWLLEDAKSQVEDFVIRNRTLPSEELFGSGLLGGPIDSDSGFIDPFTGKFSKL